MSKILSQDEVDALLTGMSGGEIETGTDEIEEDTNITAYDLTNQDRIIRGRMPTLEIINDRFARLLRATLSSALRKVIDVSSFSVDMIKFGEFMRSLPVPTSLHIFKMDPLRGHGIVVIETKLVFNLVDNFFGGAGLSFIKIEGRDFTAIENQLINKVILMALTDMEKAWNPVHPISLSFVRSETNPQFASVVAPTEVVIVIKFEVELEQSVGTLIICIPYSTIEPIRSKLYAGFQSDQLEMDHAWIDRFIERVRQAEVEISVELGRVNLSGRELLNLKTGDVIQLQQNVDHPLTARVAGVPKFRGHTGLHKGSKAFQIINEIKESKPQT
ncbi:MAG: flagellar motor switch protein FliM [Deltaproteobacteria bacterium]|nr:flagellar motor switch protein FliM [Deltaproteobacteria bacterium]MBW2087158.1 flagellar motor switch protein FliM [Deltaproteobacteria bacterium]